MSDQLELPSAKLAALNRKQNEIKSLISIEPPIDPNTVSSQYGIYGERLDSLYEAVKIEGEKKLSPEDKLKLQSWTDKFEIQATSFRSELNIWLQNNTKSESKNGKVKSEKSRASEKSKKSEKSGTSYSGGSNASSILKAKLAEHKAKTIANENFMKQKLKIEAELQELEMKKAKDYERILQEEIENLETPKVQTRNPDLNEFMKSQTRISSMLAVNQERVLLPKTEPEIFDGKDLSQYRSFKNSFHALIETRCPEEDKLFYLEKYTGGMVKQLVRSCYGNANAYSTAWSLLDEKFNNEFKIAESYLLKIENFPSIRNEDAVAYESFSVLLTTVKNAMGNISTLNQLNSPREIMNIVKKLPNNSRIKWRIEAHRILDGGESLVFDHLVKFIKNQAAILNCPIFGDLGFEKPKNSPKRILATTMVPTTDLQAPPTCLRCKKTNHALTSCIFFGKMSHDEKIDFIRKNNLCFSCLKGGHRSKLCPSRAKCSKCSKSHPTIMHRERERVVNAPPGNGPVEIPTSSRSNIPNNEEQENISLQSLQATTFKGTGVRLSYAVVPVKIKIPGVTEYVRTYMALDTFSSDCFMSEDLLKKLGVRGKRATLTLSTLEGLNKKHSTNVVNNIEVCDLDGNNPKNLPVTYTRELWPFSEKDIPKESDLEPFPYLAGVPVQYIDEPIGLLVGANMPALLKPLEVVHGSEDQPYATRHSLGWAICGPLNEKCQNLVCHRVSIESCALEEPSIVCHKTVVDSNSLNEQVHQFFNEDFKDCEVDGNGPSIEDAAWTEIVESSITTDKDGHFEIALPLKRDSNILDNRRQAYQRLMSSKRRLANDPKFKNEYVKFMNGMFEKNFAEKVPKNEIESTNVRYLVHHGVYHPLKNKLRVVYDCSLSYAGTSLNDNLYQGPDLTNNLVGVLMRFREGQIGILGDVEKMFYQVRVPLEDRDFLRFLWFPNGNLDIGPGPL